MTGESDNETYFAITDSGGKAGFTATDDNVINFCTFNHEPSDIAVTLSIKSDLAAKDTKSLVSKAHSEGLIGAFEQVHPNFCFLLK